MGVVLSEYKARLKEEMERLADRGAVFLGQSVGFPGTAMAKSLEDVNPGQRIEMPVAEELQLGISIGLSLEGFRPVSIYPRWNFLLLAANQLVNHLDRLPLFSGYQPRVIVRTAVGSNVPLNPGHQHQDDFTESFRGMLKTTRIVRLESADEIECEYGRAWMSDKSSVIVEYGAL